MMKVIITRCQRRYLGQLKAAERPFVAEQMTQRWMCSDIWRHRRKPADKTDNNT